MLVKTGVCESANICDKCGRYHAKNVDCTKTVTIPADKDVISQADSNESINKISSDAKGLNK